MSLVLLRAEVQPDHVQDAEDAARTMFAALQESRPDGVRYASCRADGSATFVVVLQVADGSDDVLPSLPEFVAFQQQLRGWLAGPPVAERLTVVGSYDLF